jgi:K+-sensing histidine kinase KdpD
VSDEGPGIPFGEREKATDRFYRGESARSTPGSGLGLSLVLAVARLHGGELRLEDNRPGLRALLALPLPEDAEGTAHRPLGSRRGDQARHETTSLETAQSGSGSNGP